MVHQNMLYNIVLQWNLESVYGSLFLELPINNVAFFGLMFFKGTNVQAIFMFSASNGPGGFKIF